MYVTYGMSMDLVVAKPETRNPKPETQHAL